SQHKNCHLPPKGGEMGVYMKVPGNSLELPDKLSSFVISPPKGGEMGVYMKVPGNSLGSPGSTFIFCCPSPEGRDGRLYESVRWIEHAGEKVAS
ncbi:MAG: hypothetical protein D3909_11265, partial [Candidatus Electrothrix sp. ATG1]|nr:hypothetical protein [Candidatus Electrothrix sp. ATG1]